MIIYTIIIPHKNIPVLLQRCLDSIPRRDDVQIIVVDDNSDLTQVDFENFPGLHDPYVEVIFDKNENSRKGAGYARNVGLERVEGKWIIFADADDFFTPEFPDLINEYRDTDYDIVFFMTRSVYSEDIDRITNRDYNNIRINSFLKKPSLMTEKQIRYGICEPWGKMIRASLIIDNNIRFEESSVANDFRFSLEIGHVAKTICAEKEPLYIVTHRDNSLSSQDLSYQIIRARMHIFNRAQTFFKQNNLPVTRQHFSYTMMWLLRKKTVWFFRICGTLIKEDKKNVLNIIDSFRIIPKMVKEKLNVKNHIPDSEKKK
ncbi:MAG: glycosyltransferase [Tannerella sp.]|jgi:glycosyltransferase involved in cell wall biosynthesis|nr:glycosyltransferase [Tannerella sp.]